MKTNLEVENLEHVEEKEADTLQDKILHRKLKSKYGNWFMWILIIQIFVMNVIFICVGVGILNFLHWNLELYIGGTLAEVFGVILVITKHLFPKSVSN